MFSSLLHEAGSELRAEVDLVAVLSYNALCFQVSCVFKMLTFIDILPQCHKRQNMMFLSKPRSHMVRRQFWVISFLLMRSVRPLFALRLFYNSQRICQIDLKTKLWLLPSTRLLGGGKFVLPCQVRGKERNYFRWNTWLCYINALKPVVLEFKLTFHSLT